MVRWSIYTRPFLHALNPFRISKVRKTLRNPADSYKPNTAAMRQRIAAMQVEIDTMKKQMTQMLMFIKQKLK
jgi:hypothetical protein